MLCLFELCGIVCVSCDTLGFFLTVLRPLCRLPSPIHRLQAPTSLAFFISFRGRVKLHLSDGRVTSGVFCAHHWYWFNILKWNVDLKKKKIGRGGSFFICTYLKCLLTFIFIWQLIDIWNAIVSSPLSSMCSSSVKLLSTANDLFLKILFYWTKGIISWGGGGGGSII